MKKLLERGQRANVNKMTFSIRHSHVITVDITEWNTL